jgi:NAD(P)-dependent dehydrogenase (short-subunit alcohol dehydrogenase family)
VTSFTLRAMPRVDGDLRVDVLLLDVTDLDSVSNMSAAAKPFQILVNNAGTNRPKPMVEASPEDFDVIMNLSVRSAFFVAQGVAKRLLPIGLPGSTINVS